MLADGVPTLGPFESAWLCQYAVENLQDRIPGSGTPFSWARQGEPVKFPESGYGAITTMLSSFEVYPPEVICTADLGPRWMVVLVDGEDLTAVTVDDFGCHMARLSEDPFVTAPGNSADLKFAKGALQPSPGIVDDLKAAAGIA